MLSPAMVRRFEAYGLLGKYEYQNGRVYDGEWKRNQRHGRGTYSLGNGIIYVGEFVEGQRTGEGKISW